MSPGIVIVGATSQLGLTLKKIKPEWTYLTRDQLDLCNTNSIQKYFATKTKIIVNCAAFTAVDLAEQKKDAARQINVTAVSELAKCCDQFIHISTDYVFSGDKGSPYTEDDEPKPINYYGQTKLQGENTALEHNKNTIIFRTSWLYSEFGANFVKRMLELAKTRDLLKIVNDQTGTPTYARDLARVIILATQNESAMACGIYNYSNEGECTWYDFTREIYRLKGIHTKVEPILTAEYPTPARRPRYSVLDKTKIKSQLNIKIPDWRDSLAAFFEEI